jgi:EF-P beta-lysylation protein EpmB
MGSFSSQTQSGADASMQFQRACEQILAKAYRSPQALCERLEIPADQYESVLDHNSDFPLLAPEPYVAQMRPGDMSDPLLRQVLPLATEGAAMAGFVKDPLLEQDSNIQPGIIHKYQGRVLLITTTGCAINCRYCFRRHFSYSDNRLGRRDWQTALDYLRQHPDISEVILSGGDPLMLQDDHLSDLIDQIESIPTMSRLRIHTRLPIVIPQRLTPRLIERLSDTRLHTLMVMHTNHANEISDLLAEYLAPVRAAGICLMNQSVLLKGVNDEADALIQLSERLFEVGILPYYLHLLDKVAGAGHFCTSEQDAIALFQQLQQCLPGYLVPRLAKEEPDKASKTLVHTK